MTHQEVFEGLRNGTITDAQLDAVCDTYGVKKTGTPNQKRAWLRTKLANVEDLSADSPYRPHRGGGGTPPAPPAPPEEDPMQQCPFCPAMFANPADLGTHIRDVHMTPPVPAPPTGGGGGGTPPTPEPKRKTSLARYRGMARMATIDDLENNHDEVVDDDFDYEFDDEIAKDHVIKAERSGDTVHLTVSKGKNPNNGNPPATGGTTPTLSNAEVNLLKGRPGTEVLNYLVTNRGVSDLDSEERNDANVPSGHVIDIQQNNGRINLIMSQGPAVPLAPPTGQRPMTINDIPSPFEKGISVKERMKRLNDKLNMA